MLQRSAKERDPSRQLSRLLRLMMLSVSFGVAPLMHVQLAQSFTNCRLAALRPGDTKSPPGILACLRSIAGGAGALCLHVLDLLQDLFKIVAGRILHRREVDVRA